MRLENDLKTHNKETCVKMKNTLQSNNKTCIIQPTGSGKSYLILKLIEDYAEQGRDIIVIEPQKYIFEQLQKKMEKYELSSDNIKFLTYSALGKLDEIKIQQFVSPKLVIVDEMHRAGAPIWGSGLKMMFDTFPEDCKYIGFSATPIRFLDGKRNMAKELFDGCIANEIGLADAILNRILPLPRYIAALYTYENEVNAITRKIQNSYNSDEEKEQLLEEVAIMKRNLDKSNGVSVIFQKYVDRNKGKYIAFCRNINHLKLMKSCLEQWFSGAGISCNFYEVHYQSSEKDNQFNAFMADDKLAVCLSVAMLAEGVHGIDGVILLRDTMSPNLYYQQIGRVFAVDMDTVPIIFDLVANCESIMDFNLKNDLLDAIDKRDKNKVNGETCVDDGQDSDGKCNSDNCSTKEITRDDIESFFVFDQVIDAVNAFKEIEGRIVSDDWTREDEHLMRQYYPSMGVGIKSMLLVEKSDKAIYYKFPNLPYYRGAADQVFFLGRPLGRFGLSSAGFFLGLPRFLGAGL
ncbi:MAG: DEAD/DEAH box helicase family protein, partial [Lachnospiraceae bacterium]|nr:DEAD/DEAH box helicase family protein [Lachnospiraceae bacterium]